MISNYIIEHMFLDENGYILHAALFRALTSSSRQKHTYPPIHGNRSQM
ncbi:hypothetical protein PthBH41_33650 [Parageobacillus thermoglucosidasius]|nr:hypothetical protein PthBH41_33650 [Parageobacillus thermoglucosidasius]